MTHVEFLDRLERDPAAVLVVDGYNIPVSVKAITVTSKWPMFAADIVIETAGAPQEQEAKLP